MKFPAGRFSAVYVIYDADVLSEHESFIEDMSPAQHMPAGFPDGNYRRRVREIVASRFIQTEGNEQYDYGYLGRESTPPVIRFFPYGTIDAEGTLPDDGYEGDTGEGQHRKWVAELTRGEWLIFADAYYIDLDASGYPAEYEETAGAITEYGHLEAVSVDNREGWDDNHGSVIGSGMYVSFAYAGNPGTEPGPGQEG